MRKIDEIEAKLECLRVNHNKMLDLVKNLYKQMDTLLSMNEEVDEVCEECQKEQADDPDLNELMAQSIKRLKEILERVKM